MNKVKLSVSIVAACAIALGGGAAIHQAISPYTIYDNLNFKMPTMLASNYELFGDFDCVYLSDNVSFDDGNMVLTIDKNTNPDYVSSHSGAEYMSRSTYGYGYYEVSMIPIKNDGVCSSFFTYAGNDDNTSISEIDIEFLGNDPTVVSFNYFVNGESFGAYSYPLGFDATEDFHKYGFLWQADAITWFVDDIPVYRVTRNQGQIPTVESKIIMNVWTGSDEVVDWIGKYDETSPLSARYDYFSYTEIDKVSERMYKLIDAYLPSNIN